MIKQCLKHIIKQNPHNRRRNTCHDDLEPEHDLIHLNHRLIFVSKLKRKDLIPEQNDNRQYRPELYHDQKHLQKFRGTIQFDKFIQNNHMPRTADRKPLCDSLNDAKQDRF